MQGGVPAVHLKTVNQKKEKANHFKWLAFCNFMVPRDGVEPPTRGFSVHCSTY